ncbi:hypothetical protein F7731_10335 [Cytobacillus depressus]|uniref:Uncharacterized protein n=1 Tax=Cytobacillus depressus TaxID=1602942 RepID=A0A6L3VB47_9BACI|nr:hypothetical protein [Cytobacillus depressus]KAB2336742.1 hypothetical protein F7731_10335 [Cytobacillus depressus]
MKKKWKIFLSIVVLLLLVAGGTIYYFFEMKEYDVADENVEEIIDSEYDIVLPGDQETVENAVDSEGQSVETSTGTETGAETGTDSSGENGLSSENPSNSPEKGSENKGPATNNTENSVTVASIKNKYRPSFESLQNQANAKIDSLVDTAYGEYKSKKNNGESISFAYFYQKYTGAGKALEEKTDGAFKIIYQALQDDLKKHDFSTSHAKDFLQEYEAAKSARESALLNKAKEAL